ncbi:MAG TPA: prolyl oligopeptidase family serine peptidase [Longimicrobiales bacterium]|nr:prolyl oligopeptidase family serine peptidase [Longimicrobiales bacterium]
MPARSLRLLLSATVLLCTAHGLAAQQRTPLESFFNVASPLELTAAKSADRIAWNVYEAGLRNVYTATAPDFEPVRLTSFADDDGRDVNGVRLSDDGSIAVFVRGHAPNRDGWVANPTHEPRGVERAIWAVRTAGGTPWRLAEGGAPALSPDGSVVLYLKDGQIYRVRVEQAGARDEYDRGEAPLIRSMGTQTDVQWSPDGSKVAFVSQRGDHSFIGLYDVATDLLRWVSPGVDCDSNPMWSPDGRQLMFLRRPGTPFGRMQQAPSGPSGIRPQTCTTGGRGQGQPDGRDTTLNQRHVPGLYDGVLPDGSVLAIMQADVDAVGDIDSPPARVIWRNVPGDSSFTRMSRVQRVGTHVVFQMNPDDDEWDRYWSIDVRVPQQQPVLLTTTDGLIEDATSVAFSSDGRTMYYSTNADDIERRHIWAVPVAGGEPRRVSTGTDVETYPQPLSSGDGIAALHFGARTPASVAIVPAAGGPARRVYPDLSDFPVAAHVIPEIVWLEAADGAKFSNQIFLPKDLRAGEKRPAIVFVHGGPRRQMMPAYHYMQFYHWSYAINQWLADQGYVVMSVNYRRGVGYGRSFTNADSAQARGNAEYRDVLAAGQYLQTRGDVDPARVGIWGLSYGGLLAAQALARNSDIFVAGVDMAGVHLYGSALDSTELSYRSSAISEIGNWTSPVFLVHGDDDRNVNFAQTVGLVQLLRAHDIEHELIVVPDDVHESLLHSRWIYTWNRMGDFLRRHVWNRGVAAQ